MTVPGSQKQGGARCREAASVLQACVHPQCSGPSGPAAISPCPSTSRGKEAVEYCICAGVGGEAVLSISAPVDEILVTSCQREAFDFWVRKLKGEGDAKGLVGAPGKESCEHPKAMRVDPSVRGGTGGRGRLDFPERMHMGSHSVRGARPRGPLDRSVGGLAAGPWIDHGGPWIDHGRARPLGPG